MSRKINPKKLSDDDCEYLLQRSWLQRELGLSVADLQAGGRDSEPEPDASVKGRQASAGADGGDDDGDDDAEPAYSELTKKQLAQICEDRGLDTSGNKPDLVERLEADDDEADN